MIQTDPSSNQPLLSSEEDYSFLFENNPNPMWIYDVETLQFLAVNETAVEKYGYSREEFLSMTLEEIRPPEDIPALHEAIRVLDHDPDPEHAWRHLRKDGSVLYAVVKSRATTFAGRPARFALIHDVTKRVAAEQALGFSESRLRMLMETTAAGIFFCRSDRFEFFNKEVERITGYNRHELAGIPLWSLIHEDYGELVQQWVAAYFRGEPVPSRHEIKIITKDRTPRWIDLSTTIVQVDGEAAILGTCVDVTEQHKAQDRLLESEEKFRTLTETTSAAIFFYEDERFKYVNHAMEHITGYSRDELAKMMFREIVHPEHRELVRQRAVARQQGKEVPERYELKILRKDGASRWLEMAPNIVDLNGKRVLVGTAVDITERKKAEDELRRSEELTHRILEAVPGGIIEVSKEGNILQVNVEAQTVLGLSALDLLKMNIADLAARCMYEDGTHVPFADFPITRCLLTFDDQPPVTLGVRRPDGGISWGVFTAVPLLDIETGMNTGAVLTFLDITVRKFTEDKLRESEERYRKFFEEDLTGDFIAGVDGCIAGCNAAFANIFGFPSVDAVLRCNLKSLLSGPDTFETLIAALQQKKKIEYHEAVGTRLDGRPVYIIENLIGLFDEQGLLIGIRGYLFDTTAHKILEQQVQEAQKIEGLGRLAGGIAHDFNNLLGIILGYSERLLTTESVNQRDIKAIHTAAQRGAGLVKQLLTFARKTPVTFEELNINTIVDELEKLLIETFPRNIHFKLDLHTALPPIIGDANQLHQAVLNLCVNARDAMPGGGTLTLKTEVVSGENLRQRFADAEADFFVCLSVADTGVGMEEGVRNKIFEPFFSTKEIGRGTGLGLAVVYGIVKTHRGVVDVISEHGKGTTFSLYFPFHQSGQHMLLEQEQQKPEVPGGTETILLVEDEEMLLDLVRSILESKGYTILVAKDGETAIKVYKDHQQEIDLVLTDLGLPKLGGWEACQQMRAINPGLNVIVATGYLDPVAKEVMMENGIREFVQKPYLAAELTVKLRELLDDAKKGNPGIP